MTLHSPFPWLDEQLERAVLQWQFKYPATTVSTISLLLTNTRDAVVNVPSAALQWMSPCQPVVAIAVEAVGRLPRLPDPLPAKVETQADAKRKAASQPAAV